MRLDDCPAQTARKDLAVALADQLPRAMRKLVCGEGIGAPGELMRELRTVNGGAKAQRR